MAPNFEKQPFIEVKNRENQCFAGWDSIGKELNNKLSQVSKEKKIIVVECYQGVYDDEITQALSKTISPEALIMASEAMLSEKEIEKITYQDVTDDRIFGFLTRLNLTEFFDKEKIKESQQAIKSITEGTIVVYGAGASLIVPNPDVLVYADMARWEIQLRMRRNEVSNLGISNKDEKMEAKYKRGYFVDWRVCDRLKKHLMHKWDYVLDTNAKGNPKMATGEAISEGLQQAIQRPFSVVPYFDAGPWGGQWMKEYCNLDKEKENYAWCFNCVPEENSMLLKFGDTIMEIPSINLVFKHPKELLGEKNHGRFGDEFPIRFDYLDTMDGGNLSLQVHPLTEYIQEKFGIHYTQDESYYLMDVGDDACVYLGLKEETNPDEMFNELEKAENNGSFFDAEKYVEKWPAKKHDHFLIPAGTIHCSGKNSMVLEISATPYIFTFKLWDWGRLGMDGRPRPINIKHGKKSVQTERTTKWVKENLVNQITEVASGDGWREEKTGLHEREFIETRRHWFTTKIDANTNGGVHVLNLIEGEEVIVESPENKFEPFVVGYAETFIVPAAVGAYTTRPYGKSEGKECATITAYVR